ncbi:MAG TPA: SDR family NAD(P)-dependent oxidoreductase, partial [Methylomirabilota bacterium]|nr:SDR family NAD(P)-dependent oxidoreductase [Methylomirabilota bacterium]
MRLSGRVALVTRGPTGTGRATVLALAREGAVVAINYSEPEAEAGETVRLAEHAGPRALPVQADVTREPEVRTMVGRVAREPGGLDGLVNNAGWTQRVPHRQLDVVPHTEPRPEGA